jgi:regulator of protease activity HflC (stomatin/prohibitin superfamily)
MLLLTLVVLLVAWSVWGIRIVPENERIAVLRLGRFMAVRGPGIVYVRPFIDTAERIPLDRDVPEWRSLPPELLREQIRQRFKV